MVDPDLDRVLLERLRSGDMSACDECVALHSDQLHRLAYRIVADRAEAEDIVQESFLQAFRGISSFEGRSSLGTWLYRFSYNNALMHLRRRKSEMISVDEPIRLVEGGELPKQFIDWCCLPENEFESSEARRYLDDGIKMLPENQRMVFILRELEGLTTRETAQVLKISPEAVKTRLHRSRVSLREYLADYFDELAQFQT